MRSRYPFLRTAMISLMVFSLGFAQAEEAKPRPRVGLVLGGGGARGFAHIGVLKVLEENHIPVDCVVGTSIGSLVGAAYASGRTTNDMAARIKAANWDDLLSSSLPRQVNSIRRKSDDKLGLMKLELGLSDNFAIKLPDAAISTQKIEFFLRDLTYAGTVKNFDQLPLPYRAVSTDLVNGEMVVFKDGDLVTAMRSSMAVPGIFPAVVQGDHILVDGGLVRNVPVDVARETCADVVIAIDVGSPPLKKDQISNIFAVADQYTRLMMIQNVKPQLESLTEKDVLITPKLGELSSADFKKSEEFIKLGQEAALAMLPKLQRYAVSPEQFDQWSKSRTEKHLLNLPIATEEIVGVKRVNPEVIESALDVATGKPLDLPQFHQKLEKVYASGDFSQLDYELIRNNQSSDLIVRPIEKSWGPNYLNLGLSFGTDFRGSTPWNISAMYRRTWMNSLGAEWKTSMTIGTSQEFNSEFYQPLRLDGLLFVAPYLSFNEEPLSLWFDNTQYATFKYSTSSLGVDLGSTVSKFGELRVGLSANKYKMSQDVGPPVLRTGNATDYGVRAALLYDQLDNYFFPKEGQYLKLSAYASIANDQLINEYGRISGEFKAAVPTSSGTTLFTVRGQVYTGEIPFYADVKWLGGFLNLSSFKYQELLTDKYLYASAQYYQTMAWLSSSYWGVALEAGKVFDNLNTSQYQDVNVSATAYIAYDSYLGPIYLGASYGSNESWSAYFMLGKQF